MGRATINLDSTRLSAIAESYPAAVRDDVVWLGEFLRDRCNRSLDVLVNKTAALGFTVGKETFSQIVRGYWQNAPALTAEHLHRVSEALRGHRNGGEVSFVETSTWRDIRDYIDIRRAPGRACRFGLIAGPTGAQKTACLKEYGRRHPGLCVHVETPERPSIARFIEDLAFAYGIPSSCGGARKRARICENVNDRKTIMIDNVQRGYSQQRGWSQPVFSYLQKLQDDTGCTVILCCVPHFERTLASEMESGFWEQFEGRCGGRGQFLRLPPYAPREDVLEIAQSFGLVDAVEHITELEEIARKPGRIRILFNALQRAKCFAGAEALTMKHIRPIAK
jgi:hypothetical protein